MGFNWHLTGPTSQRSDAVRIDIAIEAIAP
jgi:hypothetical protein